MDEDYEENEKFREQQNKEKENLPVIISNSQILPTLATEKSP